MPQAGPPPVDPGNALIQQVPAQLTTSVTNTPLGQRLIVTVRTTSATVTVLLGKEDATAWAAALTQACRQVAGSGLIVPNGHLPPPRG